MLLVPFQIGGEHYALPAADVLTVTQVPRLRPLSQAPAWVAGVFRYRGAVLPAVDLSLLISGRPCRALLSTRLLLVGNAEGAVPALGLLAERVTGTETVDRDALRETGVSIPGAEWLGAVAGLDRVVLQLIRWQPLATEELARLCAEVERCA
ncbi:chemotaxis protein CheW [Methylococcus geothermalis]|uniref:Chemotaxis protein CheW n=1 Tax=Methylococcus geothermalis TaxID=2681310 RepID=A0A858Q6A5_9GAMM|nr:chemotaxis protein CheW [Methylococcus geothermalis]QJD29335.1 chemotaxis protein CheW [Methylococcus geothermalis]